MPSAASNYILLLLVLEMIISMQAIWMYDFHFINQKLKNIYDNRAKFLAHIEGTFVAKVHYHPPSVICGR